MEKNIAATINKVTNEWQVQTLFRDVLGLPAEETDNAAVVSVFG